MNTTITEIAPGVHRISMFAPDFKIQFNSFVVDDDEPFLMHTGMRKVFPATLEAVSKVIDPKNLRWIGYSHFEPDECGALNEWLAVAPQAQAVAGFVGTMVMLSDFADRPARMLANDEVFAIGRRRLRYLSTPHVPHGWDAGLFFEETDRTLFCSDLCFQPGDPPPLNETDIVGPASEAIVHSMDGPMCKDMPYTPYTDATLQRLADLEPRALAVMHGSSFRGDGGKAIRAIAKVVAETHGKAK